MPDAVSKISRACNGAFVGLRQSALSVRGFGCSGLGGGCADGGSVVGRHPKPDP
jgi:hypothetical protein